MAAWGPTTTQPFWGGPDGAYHDAFATSTIVPPISTTAPVPVLTITTIQAPVVVVPPASVQPVFTTRSVFETHYTTISTVVVETPGSAAATTKVVSTIGNEVVEIFIITINVELELPSSAAVRPTVLPASSSPSASTPPATQTPKVASAGHKHWTASQKVGVILGSIFGALALVLLVLVLLHRRRRNRGYGYTPPHDYQSPCSDEEAARRASGLYGRPLPALPTSSSESSVTVPSSRRNERRYERAAMLSPDTEQAPPSPRRSATGGGGARAKMPADVALRMHKHRNRDREPAPSDSRSSSTTTTTTAEAVCGAYVEGLRRRSDQRTAPEPQMEPEPEPNGKQAPAVVLPESGAQQEWRSRVADAGPVRKKREVSPSWAAPTIRTIPEESESASSVGSISTAGVVKL